MNVLEVKKLTKKFGTFTAVDNISFNLKEGEILGFLGPNGAGKTTSIQMLLGILTADSGDVFYFGKNFEKHRETILENINFSSTYTNLPWDLTVKEVLTYTSYLYKIKNRKERLEKIKELFRLKNLWKEKIIELSSGQLTRVNLAKAFINFPKILLLDEPTASLDPEAARYVRNFLIEQKENFKTSILITSHNMEEVQEVSDRVIFLNHGKIIADDLPENLVKRIDVAHAKFFIRVNSDKAIEICKNKKIQCRLKGKYLNVDLPEAEIASFLNNLKGAGVIFDEISIGKPTLEDYFLQTAANKPKQKNEY